MDRRNFARVTGIRFTETHVSLSITLFHTNMIDHKQVNLYLGSACASYALESSVFVHDNLDTASLTLFKGRQVIWMSSYIEWVSTS